MNISHVNLHKSQHRLIFHFLKYMNQMDSFIISLLIYFFFISQLHYLDSLFTDILATLKYWIIL